MFTKSLKIALITSLATTILFSVIIPEVFASANSFAISSISAACNGVGQVFYTGSIPQGGFTLELMDKAPDNSGPFISTVPPTIITISSGSSPVNYVMPMTYWSPPHVRIDSNYNTKSPSLNCQVNPTPTPTTVITPTLTPTPTKVITPTPTITSTPKPTPSVPTNTPTVKVTSTPTSTPISTPKTTATPTPTETSTVTPTPDPNESVTPTPDPSSTPRVEETPTPTSTPASTPTPTSGSSNNSSSNDSNASSSSNSTPGQVLGAATEFTGTGVVEDVIASVSGMLGVLLMGIGVCVNITGKSS